LLSGGEDDPCVEPLRAKYLALKRVKDATTSPIDLYQVAKQQAAAARVEVEALEVKVMQAEVSLSTLRAELASAQCKLEAAVEECEHARTAMANAEVPIDKSAEETFVRLTTMCTNLKQSIKDGKPEFNSELGMNEMMKLMQQYHEQVSRSSSAAATLASCDPAKDAPGKNDVDMGGSGGAPPPQPVSPGQPSA